MSTKSVIDSLKKKFSKQYTMSREEIEEIVFYEKCKVQHQIEMGTWSQLADKVRQTFLIRCGLNPNEYHVDWSQILETGKITAIKIEQPPVPDGAGQVEKTKYYLQRLWRENLSINRRCH
jgi:hypothetical protein